PRRSSDLADAGEEEEIELPASLASAGPDEDEESIDGDEPVEASAGQAPQDDAAGGLSQADRLAALASEATEPPRPEAPFDELYERAEEHLTAAHALRFPRLFVGVTPFVLTLLAVGAAAGVAQLLTGSTVPQWREMGIAAGIALVVMV